MCTNKLRMKKIINKWYDRPENILKRDSVEKLSDSELLGFVMYQGYFD